MIQGNVSHRDTVGVYETGRNVIFNNEIRKYRKSCMMYLLTWVSSDAIIYTGRGVVNYWECNRNKPGNASQSHITVTPHIVHVFLTI